MRESAIAVLVSNLQAISTLNGYSIEVGSVIRYDDKEQIPASGYPAIMVTDNDDEERFPKAGGYADVYFTVNLKGMVRSRDAASTAMKALDVAIKKAVNKDRTLGSSVANISIMPRLVTDLDGNETEAAFIRPVQIYFEANEANGE